MPKNTRTTRSHRFIATVPRFPPQEQNVDRDWFEDQMAKTAARLQVSNRDDLNKAVSKTGKNPRQIHHIVKEGYECGIGTALSLAKLFEVSFFEVIENLGYQLPTVPVIGDIGPTGRIVHKPLLPVIAPVAAAPNAAAARFDVSGDSASLLFWRRERYNAPTDARALDGVPVVLHMEGADGVPYEKIGRVLAIIDPQTVRILPPTSVKAVTVRDVKALSPVTHFRLHTRWAPVRRS